MANISLGRYSPYNTFLHRLDPRTKLVSMVFLMVCIFLTFLNEGKEFSWLNLIVYGFIAVFCLIMMFISHITLKQLFKQLKMMWFMMIFVMILNIFGVKTEVPVFNFLPDPVKFTIPGINLTIYYSAIIQSIYIFIRLSLMISMTLVLTSTTKPMDLTYALEYIMNPLKKIKVPVHELAMIISLALRFIPSLLDDTERIMKAQTSRGVDFQDGKFKEKVRAIVSLIIPLFASAFQKSDELASAMEARGYDPLGTRTRYRLLKWKKADTFAFLCVFIIFAVLITLSILISKNVIMIGF